MNKETIEKAARDYVKPKASIIPLAESIAAKEGFITGAEWRINSVWHDVQKELPERENEWILLEAVINDKTIYLPVEWVNDGKGATKHMKRWAYVSDLLPDRKEVQPTTARKNDRIDGKVRMELLPWPELEEIARVYTAGAKKYGANRWQNLEDGYERYKGAMLRHLCELEKGNDIDADTGCFHAAQICWNAIAMLHFKLEEYKNK